MLSKSELVSLLFGCLSWQPPPSLFLHDVFFVVQRVEMSLNAYSRLDESEEVKGEKSEEESCWSKVVSFVGKVSALLSLFLCLPHTQQAFFVCLMEVLLFLPPFYASQ